jgi:aryl-alcohol dehydrogenase-like predicted oxidoreductase
VARATAAGTGEYAARHASRFETDFYRTTSFGLAVSSIGLGTYLGESSDADDAAYELAIAHGVRAGINVLDSAINYRGQRSERAVGTALQRLFGEQTQDGTTQVARDQIVICSKAGYIPLDRTPPATRDEYRSYVRREFVEPAILRPEEIVADGHSLAPRFLRYCLAKSRQNLGVRTIDAFYLHNPEQQLSAISEEELFARLRAAFEMLEDAVARGDIGVYGCATWAGLRTAPDEPGHLSLARLVDTARDIAGDAHHFRVVQLPVNLAMVEAIRTATQQIDGRLVSALEAARDLGLDVVGSAALMQGQLASGLPAAVREHFPRCETDAQRAVAFARSAPGLTTALIGSKQIRHVDEIIRSAQLA